MTTMKLLIRVKPGSRASSLEQARDGSWVARLRSRPIDGKANEELIALVAEHFRCRKAAVRITSGRTGRVKHLSIEAP